MKKDIIYSKLGMYKDDLINNNSDIYVMNREVDELVSYFQNGVKSDNTGGTTVKIGSLREELQQSSANLSSARSSIQYEMDAVKREIEEEAAVKSAAAKAKLAAVEAKLAAIKASIFGS